MDETLTIVTLPQMPGGLTAEWLNDALFNSALLNSKMANARIPTTSRIIAVSQSGVGDGVGMMSELSRLNLTWSTPSPGLPTSLIAKYASTNPTNRAAANGFHVYEREVRYFLEVDAVTTMRTPRCYFARLESDNYLLLMEDLGEYRIGSQASGAGLDDTTLAIDQLARLHAPFWEKIEGLDWVPHIEGSYHAHALQMMATNGWDPMVHAFGEHVPASVRAGRDGVLAAIPALQKQMNTGPVTLVHGDFRMDNLLFGQQTGQDAQVGVGIALRQVGGRVRLEQRHPGLDGDQAGAEEHDRVGRRGGCVKRTERCMVRAPRRGGAAGRHAIGSVCRPTWSG